MLTRVFWSVFGTGVMMGLVWLQIVAANKDKYLTVEQLSAAGKQALSFDRHYAMPLDFSIIAPFTGLVFFLCSSQWAKRDVAVAFTGSVIVIVLCMYVLWIGGTEAHVYDKNPTVAGIIHGGFATIALYSFIMLLVFTPKPEPVLLLAASVIIPAFLFVGTHKFLGMINYAGAASTYQDKPLADVVGWAMLMGLVWWRTWALIPAEFWQKFQ